ncbi:MAG: PAS domain S-box protein [Actinomycetota bacterium]|nr:PAS domain S-box protein [Actinomycetota bacterium]
MSEDHHRAIVETMPDGVWMIDADDRTTFVNGAMAAMLGYEPEEMLGRPPADFVVESARDTVAAALARRRAGVTERYEVRLRRKDDSDFLAEVSTRPLFADDGGYAGATAVIVDATQRHTAERSRRQLEERLRQTQRLETVGQLAGGIAHDFNNILAVILNYAHFVRERLPDDSTLRDDVDQIRRAAERASELTRQLLIFSRLDPASPRTIDANALAQDTERLLARTLPGNVALTTTPCEARCFVEVDPSQLEHVLLNLIVNARDALPDGGTIAIETRREDEWVVIAVRDDGVGMEREVVARAFEPFFTTKPREAGTGLGLATVYGTVTAAGGEVRIDSAPGVGTTVEVRLPAVAAPDEAAPEPPPPAAAGPDTATVLLVEDEQPVRELSKRILTTAGFTCLDAAGGEEALRLYEQNDVDVLVTDVVMPGMSGPELVERIGDGCPVLFMSGYAGDQPLHLPEAASLLIEKPFGPDDLLGGVRAALAAGSRE